MLVALLLLAIGWSYYTALPAGSRSFHASGPDGYYGLLTEAFLEGQLHLNIPVDPKLLSLENPYAGPQGANRPHDMSYYRGRFYVYYGPTPVLLLYLPWRWITGGYLAEAPGMMLMLFGGVALGAAWLVSLRRRWFPDVPFGWLLLLIAGLGFGPPLFPAATNNTFYGVPIAGAFFCLMLALTATDRALWAQRPGTRATWFAAASLFWGLAVGSRPIYVLGLAALAVPAAWLWWTGGREARWRWPGLRLLVAAIAPAAAIGLALMAYNYLRFDNPFDFGIRFSMASADLREARLVGPEFIGKNLQLYLLTTLSFARYYPFIILDANTWGLLPYLPLAAVGLFFPLTLLHRPLRDSRWVLTGILPAGAAAGNFALLCLFFGGEERYMQDFVPPLLLLAAATVLVLLDWTRRLGSRAGAWSARLLAASLIAYALVVGSMLTLPRHGAAAQWLGLQRLLNMPTHLVETWSGTRHGPVELEVIFPRNRIGYTEPLVGTGFLGHSDGIMVRYVDETHVQFSAFHVGRGGPVSEPIALDYAVPHRLRLSLGSLYPPPGHPLFADWPASQAERIRRRLRVELDDQTVLQGNFIVYPSVPSQTLVGHSLLPANVTTPLFTGRILHQQRPGPDRAEAAGFESDAGPVRLTVRFPLRVGDEGLPLVATGGGSGGDTVFARLQSDGQIRFGHDSHGAGAVVSAPFPFDPAADHVIDVEMGSLLPAAGEPGRSGKPGRFRIVMDGSPVIDVTRPFNPSQPGEVEFGFNSSHSSAAIEYFPGAIRRIERLTTTTAPPPRPWGPLRLSVLLPSGSPPVAEPLVVTGRTGRADVLFIRYEPDGRVRLGLDHWGVGAVITEPLQLDRHEPFLLELLSGSLLPPKGDAAWADRDPAEAGRQRDRLEVRVNSRTVLVAPFAAYVEAPGEMALGLNAIGASSCEPQFSGQLTLLERLPW